MIIAIDGPSGSGKSTISKRLAEKFDLLYIDTGAMYRALTYGYLQEDIDFEQKEERESFLSRMEVSFDSNRQVCLNGRNIEREIRGLEVTDKVSYVCAFPEIRQKMTELQRALAKSRSVIMDGRDIGTTVFPDADIKVFLVADTKERARRRCADFASKGIVKTPEEVEKDLEERDRKDSQRAVSPLAKAEDAVEIDTTSLGIEEVVETISEMIKRSSVCTK